MFNSEILCLCGVSEDAPDVERVDLRPPRVVDVDVEQHEHWQWAQLLSSMQVEPHEQWQWAQLLLSIPT